MVRAEIYTAFRKCGMGRQFYLRGIVHPLDPAAVINAYGGKIEILKAGVAVSGQGNRPLAIVSFENSDLVT